MKRDNHGSLSFALKQSAPGGNVDKLNYQVCGKYEVACWKGNKNDSPKGMTHMGLCQVSGQRKWKHPGSKRTPLQSSGLRRQGLALTPSGWHLILNFWEQQAKSVSQLTKPLRLKEGDWNVEFILEVKMWGKVEKKRGRNQSLMKGIHTQTYSCGALSSAAQWDGCHLQQPVFILGRSRREEL